MKSTTASPQDRVGISRVFAWVVLAIIAVLFAVRNLPWHLDDYDQAKQAFVSYQMIEEGKWLIQNTPTGRLATKPPLQGWLSAGFYLASGKHSWELAWRLPPFLAALCILVALWRTGRSLTGHTVGALLAAGAFGLNLYVPRLATLVRTDMLLTALIFFSGWLILEKLRTQTPWTWRDRLVLCALVLGSMLAKGPIAFGFLLPGLAAFQIWNHRVMKMRSAEAMPTAWCGWWPWLLPLAVFGGWLWIGRQIPGFEDQVVRKEFLGRFTVGENAMHHNLPPGFYTLGLLFRSLPWTLLLAAMFAVKSVRQACREDAALRWVICWTFGGLLFMELVPSKRFDRILPVVPPMCLLLAAAARYLPSATLWRIPLVRVAKAALILAAIQACGYGAWKLRQNIQNDERALVRFGERVLIATGSKRDRLAVVNGKDEGLLMYTKVSRFTDLKDALDLWHRGRIDWLVLRDKDFQKCRAALVPFEVIASQERTPEKFSAYHLLKRAKNSSKITSL
jgi:4-amino-4-deoxy-L-arabinose transferase-like glycosyltransferase